MRIAYLTAVDELPAAQWDRIAACAGPFLSRPFLGLMESTGCLTPHGWIPNHVAAYEGDRLVGVMPLYIKDNSYGEFVFDWSWAEAYQRAGGHYYPKLVSAVPFTPATGPRLLTDPQATHAEGIAAALAQGALECARRLKVSSLHCLFPGLGDVERLEALGMMRRVGCQFHWENRGYRDFDDFLDTLRSKRRKEIRRERRSVVEAGIEIEVLDGSTATEAQWEVFYKFYCSTFHRKWGEPRFSLEFFQRLGASMPERTLLLLAHKKRRYVAGAFAVRGDDTLYGRHWGSDGHHPLLHFELCYYQTIEYCIVNRLQRLDAGLKANTS